ncbi:uncharacterized protein LOC131950264 [Physella acuta]|uniref:uncharacterized protein LOC131950264 n=1 Tax=Physella acuta TaxID=109671 RepID=UPI0027DABBCA|nr:uncharacterized protein LOC131950264 [Physella acuta]
MKFYSRFNITYSMQTNNCRSLVLLVGMSLLVVLCFVLPSAREIYFQYPSWRDVSLYQIIKMHLAPRPSHMNRVVRCPNLTQVEVKRSDLELEKINFYEDTREKLRHLAPEEDWKASFYPALEREEKIDLLHVYGVFKHALDSAGLEHVLLHGSAMGAWRHHGITPWDDDIDIGVNVRDWLEIKMALTCVQGYTLDTSTNSKWSFFKSDGKLIPDNTVKKWPFLDIFLYTEDNNYVWGLNYVHLRKFVFLKKDMFPLKYVPFESFMVPVPRHLRTVLDHQYVHPETCVSHYTNHRLGGDKEVISVPCTALTDLYDMFFHTS